MRNVGARLQRRRPVLVLGLLMLLGSTTQLRGQSAAGNDSNIESGSQLEGAHVHHDHEHDLGHGDEEDSHAGRDGEEHNHAGYDHEGHGHEGHEHDGHGHSACGYNTAVKPWMQRSLAEFDTAREASRGMAKTRATVASGSRQPTEPQPIRIHTEFQLNDMQDYSKRYFLKYQLVPRMVAEIRRRMLVKKPVQGNLHVPRYCSLYYVREDGEYNCAEVADQEYCSAPDVGIKHNPEFLDGFTICSDTSKGSCRAHEGGTGVRDADFILYVAANDVGYCRQGHIVAFAGTCALDMESNRPLAGFANFCPGNLDTSEKSFQDLLETAVHEALHALFFSELLFPYYLDENGVQRTDVVRHKADGSKIVVTPAVARAAQEHFGCSNLEGAPLENEGGIGTAGNHWESRVFQGELMDGMSGAPNERAVFSAITMALIEDSGWYTANWELQGNLGFGKDAGCSFFDAACDHPNWFCPAGSREDFCSWDLKSVGRCSAELLLDGCSSPVAYRNMHCLQASLAENRQTSDSWMWGFGYGANARCMREIGPVSKVPGDGYRYTKFSDQTNLECYHFTCPGGELHVMVDGHELRCPTGQEVDLTQIGYISGRLGPCPDNTLLCDQLSCPNLCSGNGDCHGGRCTCNLGYSGEDCAHATCLPNACPQGFACNSVSGECEDGSQTAPTNHCSLPASQQPHNTSEYGMISYLLDISAGGALSDCYTSTLPGAEPSPTMPGGWSSETPPIRPGGDTDDAAVPPADTAPPGGNNSAVSGPAARDEARNQFEGMDGAAEPSVPGSSDPGSTTPGVDDTAGGNASGPGRSSPVSPNWDPVIGGRSNLPTTSNATNANSGQEADHSAGGSHSNGPKGQRVFEEGRVRVSLEVRQLQGTAPLSQSQADQMQLILAASAGLDAESVRYVAMTPPAEPTGVYVVVAELRAGDAHARVVSSLRNAEAYGILRSRLKEESRLECVSIDVKEVTDNGNRLSGAMIGTLVSILALIAAVIVAGTALLVCRCRGAAERRESTDYGDIAKEPKTVEIGSRGSSVRRVLVPPDCGADGVNTVASISRGGDLLSAREQHRQLCPSPEERPLRDRYESHIAAISSGHQDGRAQRQLGGRHGSHDAGKPLPAPKRQSRS